MNLLIITGNLGKDADQRFTPSGTAVLSFSVAVKSGYGDKEKTNWVKCTIWGKRAEGGLVPYLKKGTQVAISGEFSMNEWEKDGEKHSMPEINVNTIDLIGGKKVTPTGTKSGAGEESGQTPTTQEKPEPKDDFDDDIPF